MPARDGQTAASATITMIAGRLMLYPGDAITVRRGGITAARRARSVQGKSLLVIRSRANTRHFLFSGDTYNAFSA
jgi:hypothetical protein